MLLYVNDSICRITGYPREDLVGKSSRFLYSSDEEFRRVSEEMERRKWETGGDLVESRWVRKDGSLIDVEISTSPLGPSDPASPVVFSVRDVTRDRKIIKELFEKERLFRAFFDAVPEPAFLLQKVVRSSWRIPLFSNDTGYPLPFPQARLPIRPSTRMGKNHSVHTWNLPSGRENPPGSWQRKEIVSLPMPFILSGIPMVCDQGQLFFPLT
jgi:PAS domain S-box-containing protein